ncbi:MAG: hypothetical protein ACE5FC_09485 [Myxococcota bacterium]
MATRHLLKPLVRAGAPALCLALIIAFAGVAVAQNIPEPDPDLHQTFSGEVVYKATAGTAYGVVAVFNQDEKYAKEFRFKKAAYDELKIKEGDEVEVTWVGPRNDRTTRNDLKIKKKRSGARSD